MSIVNLSKTRAGNFKCKKEITTMAQSILLIGKVFLIKFLKKTLRKLMIKFQKF